MCINFDDQFNSKVDAASYYLSWTLLDDSQACYVNDNLRYFDVMRLHRLGSTKNSSCNMYIAICEDVQLLIYAVNVSIGYIPTYDEIFGCPDKYEIIQKPQQGRICSPYALAVNSKHVMIELNSNEVALMFQGREGHNYGFNKCPETNSLALPCLAGYSIHSRV